MINLENEDIVLEIQDLIKNIDSAKDDISAYCELVKQMFLNSSTKN